MPVSRRLPLATLARTSGGRRKNSRGRTVFVIVILLIAAAGALWYFKFRQPEVEALPPVDEVVPETATTATPASSVDEPAQAAPLAFTFTSQVSADTPSAVAAATPALPSEAPTTTPGSGSGLPLSKPTPPTPPDPAAPGPVESDFRPRLPRDVFEAQVALMRDAICPGSIDGAWGGQTRNAVAAFQEKHGLRVTGQLDNPTRDALKLKQQPLRHYTVTEADIARLRPWPKGWLARSELDSMGYSTVLEAVAERHGTHPNQIKRLNPQIDWADVPAGTVLVVPSISPRASPSSHPEYILISLAAKTLRLYDAENRLLAHFPCSIARRVEKRPVGELTILTVAPNPNYTFNPETFPDSPEARQVGRKLILQPGPNNPVGTAWIALSAGDGSYGIHGSPEPEKIGRTESSGCFRLANWNAEYLAPLVRSGMLVRVEP